MSASERRGGIKRPRAHSQRRRATRLALAILAGGATLAMAASDRTLARRTAYPANFPPGPGASVAERSCVACHSAMLVTQQHKDSTGWEKTVHTMESWGS